MCKISYIQVNMAYALCSFYATAFLNCAYAKLEKTLKSQTCPITHALLCKQKRSWCCSYCQADFLHGLASVLGLASGIE
jgi:hypothetical protein